MGEHQHAQVFYVDDVKLYACVIKSAFEGLVGKNLHPDDKGIKVCYTLVHIA